MYYILHTENNNIYINFNTIKCNSGLLNQINIDVNNFIYRIVFLQKKIHINIWNDYYIRIVIFNMCGELILSDRYRVLNSRTIKKFNLEVNSDFISCACVLGDIKFLEWWKNSGLPLEYDESALSIASREGQVNVLDWWLKSNLPLKYDEDALKSASWYGHIHVLEWWKNSGLELKYDETAIDFTAMNGHLDVLKWWKNSGLPLKYTGDALQNAIEGNQYDFIILMKNYGLLPNVDI
jgi:ankyrin repeat protein